MATSDGISDEDWAVVRDLGTEIVNASENATSTLRNRLLGHLAALEAKYGVLPSILATRADYLPEGDIERRLALLLRAHSLAVDRCDHRNALYTAASLADLYSSGVRDARRGREWLGAATRLLTCAGDASDADELDQIADALRRLEST